MINIKGPFVDITWRELFDRFNVNSIEEAGINSWAVNEGLASIDDKLILTDEQAAILGISDSEFHNRSYTVSCI